MSKLSHKYCRGGVCINILCCFALNLGGINLDINLIIIFLACIITIGILGKIFFFPLKKLLKLIFNSILGGLLIYIINIIGAAFNFYIGINIFTAIFVRNIGNSRCYFVSNNQINFGISLYGDCIKNVILNMCLQRLALEGSS